MAQLGEKERARLQERFRNPYGPYFAPTHRLEYQLASDDPARGVEEGVASHRLTLQLLALAVRAVPLWRSVVVDRFTDVWRRVTYSYQYGGGGVLPHRYYTPGQARSFAVRGFFEAGEPTSGPAGWAVNAKGVDVWSTFLRGWPPRAPQLSLALEYFATAVEQFVVRDDLALASGSVALETLLGGDFDELRFRTSQRAALLLDEGTGRAKDIFRRVRTSYDVRSSFFHTGKAPTSPPVADLLDALSIALPRMASMLKDVDHQTALGILDGAAIQEEPILEEKRARGRVL